jgi:hypothetical protein
MAHDGATTTASSLTSVSAARTLRNFLTAEEVAGAGNVACTYLSVAEQQRVAAADGNGATCRGALDDLAGQVPLVQASSAIAMHHLPVATEPVRGGIRAVVEGHAYDLRRAVGPDLAEYRAPPTPWRIASGVAALVRAERAGATRA